MDTGFKVFAVFVLIALGVVLGIFIHSRLS